MNTAKLDDIIGKAQLLRTSSACTANEFWLSDLLEALAHELRTHLLDNCHINRYATSAPPLVQIVPAPPAGGLSLSDKDAPTRLAPHEVARAEPDFGSWG